MQVLPEALGSQFRWWSSRRPARPLAVSRWAPGSAAPPRLAEPPSCRRRRQSMPPQSEKYRIDLVSRHSLTRGPPEAAQPCEVTVWYSVVVRVLNVGGLGRAREVRIVAAVEDHPALAGVWGA